MAQELDDEFSRLWQRHLTVLRDDFSATSVQALPSLPSGSRSFDGDDAPARESTDPWDEKIDSVVDALEELTSQSPITAETQSPGTPWFPDREGYTETALSSPLNSSWPRTIGSSRTTGLPHLRIDDYSEPLLPDVKGKGVDTTAYKKSPPIWQDSPIPFLLQKQLLHDDHPSLSIPSDSTATTATAATTATTIVHTPAATIPTHVHVLILTWANPRSDYPSSSQPPTPSLSLDTDTEVLRTTLKRRGYRVECRAISTDYPTAAVETMLDRFLERSAGDSLLVVYYRGFGCCDEQGRMIFASDADPNASSFFWEDVRDPIMQVPGDVLLVFDCTALPGRGAELRVDAGMVLPTSTKQLLGVCVPPDWMVPGEDMTQALCRILDRMSDAPMLSVQNLCSLMRENLRGTGLASRVFVTQLGGGRLLDICLPRIVTPPRTAKRSTTGMTPISW